jgi:hypothetical protein
MRYISNLHVRQRDARLANVLFEIRIYVLPLRRLLTSLYADRDFWPQCLAGSILVAVPFHAAFRDSAGRVRQRANLRYDTALAS